MTHPLLWIGVCLTGVLAIGLWGALSPDARLSQIRSTQFVSAHGNAVLDVISLAVDRVFSPTYATALTVFLAVLVGFLRRSVLTGVGFALAVLMTWLPVEIFKRIFHQGRPDQSNLLESLVSVNPQSSYPSGHVGFAIALSFALVLLIEKGRLRNRPVGALAALVVVVAYTRIYAGAHYFSDTVGSVFAAGLGIVIFTQVWPRVIGGVTRLRESRLPHSA